MVSRLASIAVGYGLEPWSCQTEDHKIGICKLSTKQTTTFHLKPLNLKKSP